MADRENWVDYAKAIGIVLVVYGHIARGLQSASIEVSTRWYELVDSIIYTFHMPLFFFLSGVFFLASFSKRGANNFIFNKIDTILYPYIVWSIFQGGIESFLSKYTNGNVSILTVFELFWSPRAQFWFMYALFVIFVVAVITYTFISKRGTIPLFVFSIIIYILCSDIIDVAVFKYIVDYLVYFILGVVFTLYIKINYRVSIKYLLCSGFIFIMSQWVYHDVLGLRWEDKGVESLLLAIISINFIISFSMYLNDKNYRLLAYIGSSSMAIYLMHILIGSGIRIVLVNIFHIKFYFIHIVLGVFGATTGSLIIYWFVDKKDIKYIYSAPLSAWVSPLIGKVINKSFNNIIR